MSVATTIVHLFEAGFDITISKSVLSPYDELGIIITPRENAPLAQKVMGDSCNPHLLVRKLPADGPSPASVNLLATEVETYFHILNEWLSNEISKIKDQG